MGWLLLGEAGYWSGLVVAGSGDVGGVAIPVGSGLVHPSDGGARCEIEGVGEDSCGQLGGEVDEGGPASGQGTDPDGAQALAEPPCGDGLSGHSAGEQPSAVCQGADAGVGAADSGQFGEDVAEAVGDGDLVPAEADQDDVVTFDDL